MREVYVCMVLAWHSMTHVFSVWMWTHTNLCHLIVLRVSTVQPEHKGVSGSITHCYWKCQTCSQKDIQELLSYFLFLSSHSYLSVHPSLHTTLLSSPIKSISQFLELRLEEMQALSMHHWGTTAGCPNTCQSGGAFLIITQTQLPTHPPHPNAQPPLILIHAHITHTFRKTSLKGSQRVPGGLLVYPSYKGSWEDCCLRDTYYALPSLPTTMS